MRWRYTPDVPNVGFNQMAEKNVLVDKEKLPTNVQHLKLYGRPLSTSSTPLLSRSYLID
jgi:hypothetical protein